MNGRTNPNLMCNLEGGADFHCTACISLHTLFIIENVAGLRINQSHSNTC